MLANLLPGQRGDGVWTAQTSRPSPLKAPIATATVFAITPTLTTTMTV